mgnify:CR=1 FL=1
MKAFIRLSVLSLVMLVTAVTVRAEEAALQRELARLDDPYAAAHGVGVGVDGVVSTGAGGARSSTGATRIENSSRAWARSRWAASP